MSNQPQPQKLHPDLRQMICSPDYQTLNLFAKNRLDSSCSGVCVSQCQEQVQAKRTDNWMELEFGCQPRERFSVKVVLGRTSLTEKFVV